MGENLQQADYAKLGGAVDTPGGCAAIQKDLDWLGERAARNLMKFNKAEFEVLHLGMVNSMHHCMLGPDELEIRLAESNIRVLTDTKCVPSGKGQVTASWAALERASPAG